MYVTDSSNIAINMLFVGEGSFRWNQSLGHPLPEIELVVGLGNSESSETYGKCTFHSPLLSKDTVEKFMDFLRSAEEDVADVVFRGVKPEGVITPGTSRPETQTGLGGK